MTLKSKHDLSDDDDCRLNSYNSHSNKSKYTVADILNGNVDESGRVNRSLKSTNKLSESSGYFYNSHDRMGPDHMVNNQVNNSQRSDFVDQEMMEVDEEFFSSYKQPQNTILQPESDSISHLTSAGVVIDTNFLIDNLKLVDQLANLAPSYNFIIIIPWIVIQELDSLKLKPATRTQSQRATDWIFKALQLHPNTIHAQKITETSHADDGILECCRWFYVNRGLVTVIATNDKNLRVKALVHSIRTISVDSRQLQPPSVMSIAEVIRGEIENVGRGDEMMEENTVYLTSDEQSELGILRNRLQVYIQDLPEILTKILVREMYSSALEVLKYDIGQIPFKAISRPTLADLRQVISEYYQSFQPLVKRNMRFGPNDENCQEPDLKGLYRFATVWCGIWMQISMYGPRSKAFVEAAIEEILQAARRSE